MACSQAHKALKSECTIQPCVLTCSEWKRQQPLSVPICLSLCLCCPLCPQEKIERAANYARVMLELSQLGVFVRLADYLFVEAVMATAVANVEDLLGVLTAHKQQVCLMAKQHDDSLQVLRLGVALHSLLAAWNAFAAVPPPSLTKCVLMTADGQGQSTVPGVCRI